MHACIPKPSETNQTPFAKTANAIKDSSSFSSSRNLENLPAFLEAHASDPKALGDAPKENGMPHTLIVTGAGLRAAEVVRYGFFLIFFFISAFPAIFFFKHASNRVAEPSENTNRRISQWESWYVKYY